MALAIVTFVLEQLGGFLMESMIQEAKFLHGVKEQVDQAKTELRRIRCLLKDADARAMRGGDETIRNLVAEIRESTYDLEDAILSSLSEEEIPEEDIQRGGFLKIIKKNVGYVFDQGVRLHTFGSKIKKIIADISDMRKSLITCGIRQIESSGSNERQKELRKTYSHVAENDIVGFDKYINYLVDCLTNESSAHCRVVSICGMGGLGKTTLARKVYQCNQIRSHFDCVAWVSISQQCQVGSIWKELLDKVCPDNKIDKEREVCRKLYEVQKDKKCLIVLDDIWTIDTWDCLSPAFPKDATNSTILLTTRKKDLALYVNGIICEPQCLDDEESWELFAKVFTVSHSKLDDENKKKEIGKTMLKHCGGLPLAITVLRGILSQKQSVFEWEAIQNNAKMYINKGKLPELRNASDHEGVSWVLGLSYDELPYQMKPCFLHLASFPEDHEIRVGELCKIWMAEGFVSSENKGHEFLHELVQRCMVLKGKLSLSYGGGRIKTCRVHDLMRDLCLLKAREENFLQIPYSGDISQGESKDFLTRRLAVFGSDCDSNELLSKIKGDCVRSCICFKTLGTPKMVKPLFKRFHMFRVLKFENCREDSIRFPEEVGNLSHLRFFSLRGSRVDPLPSSISKLKYLQTLDLRVDYRFYKSLLESITKWRLHCVRHLYLINGDISCWKLFEMENGSNVQTLSVITTSFLISNHLSHFTNLTKLSLEYDEKLPEASQFPPELVKLTLWCGSSCNPMPTLEKLPKLRSLVLFGINQVNKLVCSRGGFPLLEFLRLSNMDMEWEVEEGAFPSLCHLSLAYLYRVPIPDGLRYVTSLKEIVFKGFGPELEVIRELKERRGDDFNKVKHVPSLVFNTFTYERKKRRSYQQSQTRPLSCFYDLASVKKR